MKSSDPSDRPGSALSLPRRMRPPDGEASPAGGEAPGFGPSAETHAMTAPPNFSPETVASLSSRAFRGRRVTWLGLWINAVLVVGKGAGGIFGGSSALLADAVHSVSDILTDITVLFALKFSARPPDRTHPYGHGRMETVAAFCVGLILLGAGLFLLYRSATDLWIPRPYRLHFIALPFVALAIALKEGLYRLTLHVARQTRNQALLANAWHHRSDAFSSLAALAGIIPALFGYWRADAAAAALVAALVIWAGVKIFRESLADLVDTAPAGELEERIRSAMKEISEIENVHALRIRRVGPFYHADVHIQVRPDMTVAAGHRIAHQGKDAVLRRVKEVSEITIHLEPVIRKEVPL